MRKILVAYDGSADAMRALQTAASLAQETGSRLTLLTVVHQVPVVAGPYVAAPLPSEEDLVADAEAKLARAKASIPEGVAFETLVRSGIAADEILDAVEEGQHDLVVTGTRGHGDLASLALGSVSHELIRRAPVPVLVARDGEVAAAISAASP